MAKAAVTKPPMTGRNEVMLPLPVKKVKKFILFIIFQLRYIVDYVKLRNMTDSKQKITCEFEKIIIEAIRDSGLSQVELSEKSSVGQSVISLFKETDPKKHRTITLPVAERLCKALGLELVRGKYFKKGDKKMFHFRKNCDLNRARELCKQPIQARRGKMICEQILKELDSGYLCEKTKDWFSKWVNPARTEEIQPVFEQISIELFGHRIGRSG